MTIPGDRGDRWVRTEARPLGDRFPVLRELIDQPVEIIAAVIGTEFSTRVRTMLVKGRIQTCQDLAEVSEEELGDLRHVGKVAVDEALSLLRTFEEALPSLGHATRTAQTVRDDAADDTELQTALQRLRDQGNPVKPIEPHLHLLAQWSLFSGRGATLGDLVDAVSTTESSPADVRAGWDAVRAFDMEVAPVRHHDVLTTWLESLTQRERDIVTHRIVWADRTLDDVGQQHGVTREAHPAA
ncbi:sigma factor-like helix-turn-helix DNA-binding protein [Serinicoccus marinus]|uniref:sigma factor-like helix-turn-helix DNA-binding protein n=1 Tax=Serinicoccus marinus TaxID=247333 RepID=UPI0003B5977E|nr:sigma factor-like helix-turn-helix DNA-binding protein [Serinicoccus marinus]